MHKRYDFSLCLLLAIPVIILIFVLNKKIAVKSCKNKIEKAKENIKNNTEIKPFLNVNNAYWEVIVLIPGISKAVAKKVRNRVKKKRFNDFVEFANFTGLEIQNYKVAKQILKF